MSDAPGLIVLGTDTDCGKTVVSAGLVAAFRRRGVAALPWKPFASGVPLDRLTPGEDADLLLRAAGLGEDALATVSPCRFEEPLAPSVAARRAGVIVDPAAVLAKRPTAEFLIVEGCGGLAVPLAERYDMRDLCFELDLPVVIVARPGLGTINHTTLTVEGARNAGLQVLGVIISGFDEHTAGVAERTNVAEIEALADVRVLGVLPRLADPGDPEAIADAVLENIDLTDLVLAARQGRDTASIAALDHADQTHVWHPFTQMREYQTREPIVIERARGPWLYDSRGRRYLDAVSSLWVTTHGHREPAIDAAVRAQLGRLDHSTLLGLANRPSVELAVDLLAIAPGHEKEKPHFTRVFYSDSGSTAVEIALKMAFQGAAQRGEPGRNRFVRFTGAYHGDTLGSVSVGGIDLFHRIFGPLLFQALSVPAPDVYHRPAGETEEECLARSLGALKALLTERGDEIAAVVVEPIMQGAAGMIAQPAGWLTCVAELTRAAGALLICDEVATGFGRTGRMFAVEHENVLPDLLCVAKGLTGGYLPLAATIATEAVHNAFLGEYDEFRTFFHGHTYTGNPLACAAALANLRLFAERGTVAQAAALGDTLGRLLEERVAPHAHVGDIRRRGVMIGIELVADAATRSPFPVADRIGARVCDEATARGVRLRPLGDVIVIMPPLTLSDEHAELLVDTLAAALAAVLPDSDKTGPE